MTYNVPTDDMPEPLSGDTDRAFKLHLIFAEFNEWNCLTDGEILSEPIPGY